MRLIFFILSFFSFSVFGQDSILMPEKDIKDQNKTEYIYGERTDPKAEFPGGSEALYKFISDSLAISITYAEITLTERIYTKFTIDTIGALTNIEIAKGINPELDQAALDLVKKMPNWITEYFGQTPIPITYILPIEISTSKRSFCINEVESRFLGGSESMLTYLKSYNTSGKRTFTKTPNTEVKFTVAINGKVKNVLIFKNGKQIYNPEITHLFENMPKWSPAQEFGKSVESDQTIPIYIKRSQPTSSSSPF
jgi:hypothetical protein